ncbi:MAG: AsmA family protein [Ruegeria sp.]|uniref:AsmA family protein n=1 Tax=Ruegeria sp. TaxID=1879320 RepID=UPI00349E7F9E
MRWLIRIVFILVAVAVLVVGGLLLLPGDKIARLAADQVRAQTGRELTFDGDVRLTFWPVLGVETGPVTLDNAEWAGEAPMLKAKALSIGVTAASLFSGSAEIQRIVAQDPVLRLEVSQGRANWDFGAPPQEQAAAPASSTGSPAAGRAPAVSLERLEFNNARLIYVEDGETSLDFGPVDLTASWPSPDAPLDVNARLAPGGEALDVTLRLPDLPGFASGAVTGMELDMNTAGGDIRFDGQVNISGEFSGAARVSAKNTSRMLAALGQSGITLPKGLGQAADLSMLVTYTRDGRVALRDVAAQLDSNRFEGEADVAIAATPQVTARFSTGDLDLTGLGGGSGSESASSSGGNAQAGWSKDRIDASALALANGSIRLSAKSVRVPGLTLGQSQMTLALDRSRAVLKMHPVSLFSGALTGQVVANNRNGLSVGGNLQANGIEMQEALSALGGIERLSGKASGTLEFLGVGETEDQIMRSLSGQGRVEMGRGVISGIDLDNLMGSGKGAGGTTVFNSLTASYKMNKGNLFNSDLLMQLDNFRADGEGRIGLGARDIDYLFTPVALRANSGQGLEVPVRIVGPWADPSIRPDLSKALKAAAGVKKEEVEQQAKEKLRRKLSEELDTTVTEDQDVEELIKDKLENEAKKGLLKLFGSD